MRKENSASSSMKHHALRSQLRVGNGADVKSNGNITVQGGSDVDGSVTAARTVTNSGSSQEQLRAEPHPRPSRCPRLAPVARRTGARQESLEEAITPAQEFGPLRVERSAAYKHFLGICSLDYGSCRVYAGQPPRRVTFLGRPYDGKMIKLAYAYEQATHHCRPPTSTTPL
jgi:hypothetical protein